MSSAQKKSEWKDIRFKKTNKRTKLAIGVLVLVTGLLIVSWVTRLTQNLFSTRRSYAWNGEFNINLLLRSKNISLFSYNPKGEKLSIVNIPDEVFLNVPHGFGFWQLQAIYKLGQSQKLEGDQLLVDTLTSFLAIPIDGFLDFSTNQNQKTPIEIVNALRANPFSGFSLFSGLQTDLTMWELLKLSFGASSVRFDKVEELDLGSLGILDKENLPDGTPVLTADPIKLDGVLTGLTDPVIIEERKSIAVLNATDHPQLANKAARLIANLGGNVIITANARQPLEKTQVIGENSLTLKRLRQIFASDDKISTPVEDLIYQRAQINVLLGEDYFTR